MWLTPRPILSHDYIQRDEGAGHEGNGDEGISIPPCIGELVHLGTSFATAIAAGFHGCREVVGAAEGGDEERDEERDHVLGALPKIAVHEVSASGGLGFHDAVSFFQKCRDETERDGHHHGELVRGNPEATEWHQEVFDAVGQDDRARGIGEQRGEGDEEDEAQCHDDAVPDAFFADVDEFPRKDFRPRGGEDVDEHGENKDHPEGLDGLPDHFRRYAGEGDGKEGEAGDDYVGIQVVREENRDDEDHGTEDLRTGIHLVQVRMAGIVLAEGHISEHVSYLPASLPFFLRLLRSFLPLPARGYPSLSGRGGSA